jgi:hypothetical protein
VSEVAGNNINKLSISCCVKLTSYAFIKGRVNDNTLLFRQDAVEDLFICIVFVFSEAVASFPIFSYFEWCLCLIVFLVCDGNVTSHSLQFTKNVLVSVIGIPPHTVFYHFNTKN